MREFLEKQLKEAQRIYGSRPGDMSVADVMQWLLITATLLVGGFISWYYNSTPGTILFSILIATMAIVQAIRLQGAQYACQLQFKILYELEKLKEGTPKENP